MVKKIGWLTMTFLAMIVALYSGLALVTPIVRPPLLQNLFDTVQMTVSLHLAGGLVAILAGAFQVNSRLRKRFLPTHRWLGRLYLFAVLVGSLAGLSLAMRSAGGLCALRIRHDGGVLALLYCNRLPPYPCRRQGCTPRLDVSQLCVDAGCRDTTIVSAGFPDGGNWIRGVVSGNFMVVLSAQFVGGGMDHSREAVPEKGV
jgi:hypothetical protein